ANLADTAGGRLARAKRNPGLAIPYYFGNGIVGLDPKRPGKWPLVAPQQLVSREGSIWKPLTQKDLAFMAHWGFEVYAGDVDRMIALIRPQDGSRTIFLAGHSQGGGFVANYAGRKQSDGRRGYEKHAGLIFLDGGPSAGGVPAATTEQIEQYVGDVAKLRRGAAPVYTGANGALGNMAGPAAAAAAVVINAHYNFHYPNQASDFGPPANCDV